MKAIKLIFLLPILFWCIGELNAQQNTVAAGGEANGAGGGVSYSIGQVFHASKAGNNASLTEGLQQPYEIFVTVGLEQHHVQLEMEAYPNPVGGMLNLRVEETSGLSFSLLDVQGKIIRDAKIIDRSTHIPMDKLSKGIYFLQISESTGTIKTFKIIKN